MLLIHTAVHLGHLRLIGQTGASRALVALAVLANGATVSLGLYHLSRTEPALIGWIAGFFALALLVEIVLHFVTAREVRPRTPPQGQSPKG